MQHNIFAPNIQMPKFKPIVAGYEDCKRGHSYGPAVRHQWLIHYVVSGIGYFKIRGKQYTLSGGSLFVIPPYVEIFYVADEDEPWSYIWIGFDVEGELPCKLEDTFYLPKAKAVFDAIKTSETLTSSQAAFLTGRLWDLFAILLEAGPQKNNLAETIRDMIHSEYAYGITISEIAQALNINRSYLSMAFKEKYGVAPKQYLLGHRMKMAASLLQRGNKVKVAATSVGYADAFVFSKAFKKYYGISPAQYAKRYR